LAALDAMRELVGALDALCALDPAVLADGEAIQLLHQQLDRLQAAATRATARFDSGRAWEADGARAASAWLAVRCHLPVSTARRRVQLGRALRHMPTAEPAWLGGEIGEAHIALLAAARTPQTAPFFERDEGLLVTHARTLTYRHFARVVAYWGQVADPDGTEKGADAQHEARRVHLSQTFGGSWTLDGVFDPIGGSIVAGGLDRIEKELFAADWAEAKALVGDSVSTGDLSRTAAQRRADALVEMARRAGAVPSGGRLPDPLFTVLVGYETFAGRTCELANGTAVSPGSLVRWLDGAWAERVVFDSPDRIRNVGVRRRIFTGATRRAVEVRDRECFHDLCDLPADECEIDHVQPWSAGGLTVESNGRPACGFHNRARQRQRQPP
jgi:Domain of unknown function (DUF222)